MKGAASDRQQQKIPDSRRPVQMPDYKALFDSAPDPCLVLDRDLVIVAANQARLRVTMTTAEDTIGRHLFEVFPDNPADVAATGVRNLGESLKRVLANRTAETMPLQRYDIRSFAQPEQFEERYWTVVNTPVLGSDGEVEYIIHRVQDVTGYVLSKRKECGNSGAGLRRRVEELEGEIYLKAREAAAANSALEDAVRASSATQKRFDSFMAHLPAAAWMKDMDGRYIFANAETERLFQVRAADLLGKRSEEVFSAEIAQRFFEIDRRILAEGGNLAPVQVVHQSAGEERHLLVTKFVIRNAAGAPEFIAGVAIDTTQTMRMEEEIQRLASFSMENPNPVMELTYDGVVTFCNPAAAEVLRGCNYTPECNPFIPDDLPELIAKLRDRSNKQTMREVEMAGNVFEELIILVPHTKTVRCYTMDVTRRKRAEREREQLLLQLQAVLENINEGVVITGLDGMVLDMNKEALELHDFEDMDEVRRHVSEFQDTFEIATLKGERLHLDDWPALRALRGERFFDYEVRVYNKLSGRQWVGSYSGTPVSNSAGEPMLAVLSIRDITERKEMEEQIVSLNSDLAARVAELEQTNQELEAFNRMVSHDLRQPLNTIATSCQAIQMLCDVGDECKSYIDIAYKKVLVMNDLIESLLKFSRSTHRELRRETVDLSEMARGVYGDIRLAEPQRRVTLKVPDRLIVDGDAGLLRSVLENLIGNAWKYTSMREEAVIEVGVTEFGGEETYFVRDNGAGFESAQGSSLFTPFRRLPGSEKFSGFGIGLATVERIIRRHGGRVCAEGEPGKGATFYFTLPRNHPLTVGG